MMITCAIKGCPSTQFTKINGEQITFYAFPEDDGVRNQWFENCYLAAGIVNDAKTPYLCELHFEKVDFTSSKDLKAEAVPTLFGHIEEPPRKRLAEDVLESTVKKMFFKDKILNEQIVIPSESPFLQDDITKQNDKSKMNISIDSGKDMNGCDTSLEHKDPKAKKSKIYRLTIRIDKIRNLSTLKNKPISFTGTENIKSQELENRKNICKNNSCKLKKCLFYSKPALQCEVCKEYYFQREEDTYSCSVCSETFPTPNKLFIHIRKHFTCEICHLESDSEKAYEKHIRLHVSNDSSNPFKCNQCYKTFAYKEKAKHHCLNEHLKVKLQTNVVQINSPSVILSQQIDYQCANCKLNFKTEQSYNDHIKSHRTKEGLKYNISDTNNIIAVPNPLTGNQIGILQPIKFSCRVCQRQFDNVGEVDAHTKTHLNEKKVLSQDGLKCNICKKTFTDNAVFGEHLKHHLSRAYPCPVCSKAFINRTTLKAHLETHSKS